LARPCSQIADLDYLKKHWGVLVCVATFFVVFGGTVLAMRLRRTEESYLYIRWGNTASA
jgi:hypothetical protein